MKTEIIKTVNFKGKQINLVEDAIGQQYVTIDCLQNVDFASIADAKRYINGEPLKYLTDSFERFIIEQETYHIQPGNQ